MSTTDTTPRQMTDDEANIFLERELFGDDLKVHTAEHIADAVADWWLHAGGREMCAGITDSPIDAWNNRAGHPWQGSVETFVAAHRREPRDFGTWEKMGLVLEALKEKGIGCVISTTMRPIAECVLNNGVSHFSLVDHPNDIPLAVRAAAVAALEANTDLLQGGRDPRNGGNVKFYPSLLAEIVVAALFVVFIVLAYIIASGGHRE